MLRSSSESIHVGTPSVADRSTSGQYTNTTQPSAAQPPSAQPLTAQYSHKFEQLFSSDLSPNKRAIMELLLTRSLHQPLHPPSHTGCQPTSFPSSSPQGKPLIPSLDRRAS